MDDKSEDRVIDVYRRHGAHWAKLRGTRLAEGPWLDRFCALLPARADILDIGCGSGMPIAHHLISRGFQLTGVDAAPEMLALFEANLPGVPTRLADMRHLALGHRFAGLLAWDSFFHLSADDQRGMFQRFRAHAAPNAALMFTSGPAEGRAIGELQGEALHHASLGPTEYRERLAAAGFRVVGHASEDPSCGNRTVWLAQFTD